MQTTKMSLASIKNKLSRAEMKNIMAGSGGDNGLCITDSHCWGRWVNCGGVQIFVTPRCVNFHCTYTYVC